ncbi:hypothetical protein V8C34DRAFT_87958 [Trichoderma compactum]
MAPGYRSPFDHAPSPKPVQDANAMPPALAIFLCVSIIVCLTLFVFCTATRHNHHEHPQHRDEASVPAQQMVLDRSYFPKNLVVRPGEHLQRAVNEGRFDDLQQPLLPAGRNSNSADDVEVATRGHDNVYRGPIHWHGTNMLNTSWGWMA